ncbi:MAG: histidine triad nucleotide-binding protein [Blastochloris viridis]|uniref:Histidine triad nucleotide-binding protein n=1 Tax=Blastochloris viridis TaxID=1079 RepID=A0A6N4R166_BLAVI|nr:MAG: histidine triad nucleotide-binding protein [Blastochloris viridis]
MRYSFDENPTIFGKILRGEIPCKKVYEDDHVLAFHDIAPKAPVHVLVIPKTHLEGLQDAQEADADLLGRLMVTANKIAAELGLKEQGYRLITNAGKGAGQEVPHLHLHILSGPSGLPGF